jgi:hypothetical protein
MDFQNVIVCCHIELFLFLFIDVADKLCAAENSEVTCIAS